MIIVGDFGLGTIFLGCLILFPQFRKWTIIVLLALILLFCNLFIFNAAEESLAQGAMTYDLERCLVVMAILGIGTPIFGFLYENGLIPSSEKKSTYQKSFCNMMLLLTTAFIWLWYMILVLRGEAHLPFGN
ncbi:MAG: hypothetical protein Q4D98_06280 [Planctomycetia bacterium]|nr:hypothetical protein [Planctomycetia bacterium]